MWHRRRVLVTVGLLVLLATLGWLTATSVGESRELQRTRIEQHERIEELREALSELRTDQQAETERLRDEIAALREQLVGLGFEPVEVIVRNEEDRSRPSPTPEPTQAPEPGPPPPGTPGPSPTPTPTPCPLPMCPPVE